ncbi:MAG: MFS transporter [Chloroflexota bacterium]
MTQPLGTVSQPTGTVRSRSLPQLLPFYYGWVIVAVLAATGAVTMGLGGLNFGLFIKPIGDELGVGRAAFGWAQSARQFASAATAPIIGPLIDRFGGRLLLAFAATATGLSLASMAFVHQDWQIICLFALMGIVGMNGPGALVTNVPVTKWFVARRAKAMAMASLGVPLGGVIFVPLTQILIDAYGWRQAATTLGLLGVGLIVPMALLFIRREPEDFGLLPDGRTAPTLGTSRTASPRAGTAHLRDERSWTREEALRSGSYWRLTFVFSIVMMAVSGVGVHRIPSFMDRGLDPLLISYATGLDGALAGVSTFVTGMLAHRFPARVLGCAGFMLLCLASIITTYAHTHAMVFLSMGLFGLGIGTMLLMQNYLWAEYFGRRHLGSIRGVVMPITLFMGGIGAPISGYVRDATGEYTSVWLGAAGLMAIGALVLLVTPKPPPPARASAPR